MKARYYILIYYIRLEMNIKDLYKKITGIEYPNYKKYIEIEVSGDLDDGSDTLLPSVVLKLE
jgi:hypothetical protein